MKKLHIVILVIFLSIFSTFAEIRLPAIVSSNMVLQRNSTVNIWGWADKGEKIDIKCSWLNEIVTVKADKAGKWETQVNTTDSKISQQIQLKSKNSDILLENILFGDVWLCSGQSNMYQPICGYGGQSTYGASEAVLRGANPNLRLFHLEIAADTLPQEDVKKYKPWREATPQSIKSFSAIGYFFGDQIQEFLDVPVGIIHTSWGGSGVRAWMSDECFSHYEEYSLEGFEFGPASNRVPTVLYNAMLHPFLNYRIKGVLWYQGETDRCQVDKYQKYFPAMVQDWRKAWQIGDFPFYYVQIAPYKYDYDYSKPRNAAFVREVQLQSVDKIPNSGMAVTMDLGEEHCIHPAKKKEVADRLLLQALSKTYGQRELVCDGPVYETFETKDGGIELQFKNIPGGIHSNNSLKYFEIAGEDRVFYPAEATLTKHYSRIFVKSEKVEKPVAVRYAWDSWIEETFYNNYQLPASSFRTDDWDNATRAINIDKQ